MFAVVEIKGQQFKIAPKDKLQINLIPDKEGSEVSFRRVMLVSNNDKLEIGKPYLTNYEVTAKVLSHFKGEKIRVYKMKRKTRYHKTIGHRQPYTNIEILEIKTAAAKPKTKASTSKTESAVQKKTSVPKIKKVAQV